MSFEFIWIPRVVADDWVQLRGDRDNFTLGRAQTEFPGFTPNMKWVKISLKSCTVWWAVDGYEECLVICKQTNITLLEKNKRKRSEPIILPWGTPDKTGNGA